MTLASLMVVESLGAQGLHLGVDAGVSHARPPSEAIAEVEAGTYVLGGLRAVAGPLFGSLYGGQAVNETSGSWAAGLLGLRASVGHSAGVAFGATLTGSAFTVGEPTPYRAAVLRAEPELRLGTSRTRLALRGAAGLGRSEVEDLRTLPSSFVVSDLWLYGGGVELSHRVGRVSFWAGGEAHGTASGSFRAAGIGSEFEWPGGAWRLEVRVWDGPGGVDPQVTLRLRAPVDGAWAVEIAGGHAGPDPLLNSPAALRGSLMLSWAVVRPRLRRAVYVVTPDGLVTFQIERAGADRVSVAGDFSGWQPVPMDRREKRWIVRLRIAPGVHHFAFLADGKWFVPDDAPGRVADEFGQVNAILVVPSR